MRILLAGNFSPPFEEESLHHLTLLHLLKQAGHDCLVLNTTETLSLEKEFIDVKNYVDFVFKFIRHGYDRDVVHFFTKGYDRTGLMKLFTMALIGKLLGVKLIITFHAEMFSIFGRMRSAVTGQPLLRACFWVAKKVICGDQHTYEMATAFYPVKEKFSIIPEFICGPIEVRQDEERLFKPLVGKKRVILVSNVQSPSYLLEVLDYWTKKYFNPDTGLVIACTDIVRPLLQRIAQTAGKSLADNVIFVDSFESRALSVAYWRADFVLRIFSCDGPSFFEDIAFIARRAVRSSNYLYFPLSVSLIRAGEVASLTAQMINSFIVGENNIPDCPPQEDFTKKIMEIYEQ